MDLFMYYLLNPVRASLPKPLSAIYPCPTPAPGAHLTLARWALPPLPPPHPARRPGNAANQLGRPSCPPQLSVQFI